MQVDRKSASTNLFFLANLAKLTLPYREYSEQSKSKSGSFEALPKGRLNFTLSEFSQPNVCILQKGSLDLHCPLDLCKEGIAPR